LLGTDLSGTNFEWSKLKRVDFQGAQFWSTNLIGTDLSESIFGSTTVVATDLSQTSGLEKVVHYAPSSIGIDTFYLSKGTIPDGFLRGAGVPEDAVALARSIRSEPAIQFYSCFISYSHLDEGFSRKLFGHLRANGVRAWYAPEEMKGGRKLHDQIDNAIRLHDKLLLVMSDHSILSDWIKTEVKHACRREKKEGRRMLFPIRLTDYQTLTEWKCIDGGRDLGDEVREYFIPDFSNWQNEAAFDTAFKRLLCDLQASEQRGPM
jgi:hypothetical protein